MPLEYADFAQVVCSGPCGRAVVVSGYGDHERKIIAQHGTRLARVLCLKCEVKRKRSKGS